MSREKPLLRVVLPLRVWLTLSHFAMLALPVVAILATGALATDLRDQTRVDLQHQGQVLATVLTDRMQRRGESLTSAQGLSPVLTTIRQQTLAGIRIVDVDGIVVATSGSSARGVPGRASGGGAGAEGRHRQAGASRVLPLSTTHSLASEARFADVRVFVAVPIVDKGQLPWAPWSCRARLGRSCRPSTRWRHS